MPLIHLLSLLSAAFLAGLVSSTTEEENIPLERSPWRLNIAFLFDNRYLESGQDIVFLKRLIWRTQFFLKNHMEPSIRLNITGLDYVKGYHTKE